MKNFIAFLSICITFGTFAQTTNNLKSMNNYDKYWKKVDSLQLKGLPQSALKPLENIYEQALKENNPSQLIKAIIHRLKFTSWREEDAIVKNLQALENDEKAAQFPTKQILSSMIAEIYWQYYQMNRYEFDDRSTIVGYKNEDIRTWDLKKIIETTTQKHLFAIAEKEKLQNTSLEPIDVLLVKGYNSTNLRPTLYDFLAHRALDFFSSEEPQIIRPAEQFVLNDEKYLFDAQDFSKINIISGDSLAFKFYAIKIYQELTQFHLLDKDAPALVELDLSRLSFVYRESAANNKEALYLEALQKMEKRVLDQAVSTRVSYEIAQVYFQRGLTYKPAQSNMHKWELKKAFEYCEETIKRFPTSEGAQDCKSLQSSIAEKSFTFKTEETNLPNRNFKLLCTYKNVGNIYLRIYPTNSKELSEIQSETDNYYKKYKEYKSYSEVFIDYFKKKRFLKAWQTNLPIDGDMQSHSVELPVESLTLGDYVIIIADNQDFSYSQHAVAYDLTTVSDISLIDKTDQFGSHEFYILSRTTGKALPKAKIKINENFYDYANSKYINRLVGNFETDNDGYFKLEATKVSRNLAFEISYENDQYNSATNIIRNRSFYQGEKTTPRIAQETIGMKLFTDRAIYRPGQTIYFKGIAYQGDGKTAKTLAKFPVEVSLYDVNEQLLAELNLISNEFGSFNGTFIAPSTGLLGQMKISADSYTEVNIQVEEYKRPKFEVKIDPIKGSFKLEDEIAAKMLAKAYSGANIDGAQVKYRVVRQAKFPIWWFWRYNYNPSSPAMEIANGTGKTNEKGEFEIKFKAIPDLSVPKESLPTFTYTIYTDVTDINGETRSGSYSINVGYVALNINTNIPTELQPKDKNEFEINTTNLSGEFEPAEGSLIIYALKAPTKVFRERVWDKPDLFVLKKEEHDALFPFDEYADEKNEANWPRSQKVYETNFNTSKSKKFIFNNLSSLPQGQYIVEIKTKDRFGTPITEEKPLTIFDARSNKLPTTSTLNLRELNSTVEPGGDAKFLLGTSYDNVHCMLEIAQGDSILSRRWIDLKNEQKELSISITENNRGNISYNLIFLKENRVYNIGRIVTVPFTNKELDISFETFRNKLQPGQADEWRLKIKGKSSDKLLSEMVATMYDASLDAFKMHNWYFDLYRSNFESNGWSSYNAGYGVTQFTKVDNGWNSYTSGSSRSFDYLNWFGYNFSEYFHHRYYDSEISFGMALEEVQISKSASGNAAPKMAMKRKEAEGVYELSADNAFAKKDEIVKEEKSNLDLDLNYKGGSEEVKVRKNFNETAFFYPNLETDKEGSLIIKFTIPEALTRWKMLGFAHTKDMKFGLVQNELITQKELMVVPNVPRFFRENDKITFASKITNLTDKDLLGISELKLFNALNMQEITSALLGTINSSKKEFNTKAGQSTVVEWKLDIPEGIEAITYRIVAKSENYSDGEEMAIPVLTNRMLVTETLPLPIRSKQKRTFTLGKLVNNQSTTLKNHRLTLEFTSQPAWYAIQALPYLMEYPYECAEQTFSRFYANSIAAHVVNSSPKIKMIFDTWRSTQPDALLSNLEKNQELKNVLLEETPWVRQAKNESESKRRIAVLFDLNKMSSELDRALEKLVKMQKTNGAWPWFDGMPEDRYITQHIICGIGHLDHLGINSIREDTKVWEMTTKAISYLDSRINNDYQELKKQSILKNIKLSDQHIGDNHIHYLYMRSFFKDIALDKSHIEAFNYFSNQSKKYWTSFGRYSQAMIALSLYRNKEIIVSQDIIKSIKEHALISDEMGMYWKENYGYYWYEAPIESQALMIELFAEVAKDSKAVDDLKVWLIKEKQTNQWKTTKATTEACYALLLQGTNWLASEDQVEITIGNTKLDPKKMEDVKVEAGSGYFKKTWSDNEINSTMGQVMLDKKDEGVSWGALYWQYFEQLDKITPAETPLKLRKELFLQQNTPNGPVITPIINGTKLATGDQIKVRIELRVDRNMEYVHLKDMRASGFEPTNVISQYKYQDGLHYYESTRDAATNFFIGYLPKGTYVFEYPLIVSQKGDFSNGITTIQCMYAPEFSSHSQGIRVKVD